MDVVFSVFSVVWVFVFVVILISTVRTAKRSRTVRSSDGHVIPKGEDLTCETNEGHHHTTGSESEFGKRYIVHNEPETGYVVLNGVKRKLTDCKNL